jgi:hypothetical protein
MLSLVAATFAFYRPRWALDQTEVALRDAKPSAPVFFAYSPLSHPHGVFGLPLIFFVFIHGNYPPSGAQRSCRSIVASIAFKALKKLMGA